MRLGIPSLDLGPFGEKGGGFFIEESKARLVLGDDRGEGHLLDSENWLTFMTTTQSLISGGSSDSENLR